jgi:hypothetical protein
MGAATSWNIAMDRILISNLRRRCIIGVPEEERGKKQDVVIDLTIFTVFAKRARATDLRMRSIVAPSGNESCLWWRARIITWWRHWPRRSSGFVCSIRQLLGQRYERKNLSRCDSQEVWEYRLFGGRLPDASSDH